MWWKIVIVVTILILVIIQLLRSRTWCPYCKKRTGDRFYEETGSIGEEQDWYEEGPRPFCSRCLEPKRN